LVQFYKNQKIGIIEMVNIDMNSEEFKSEMEKTKKFTDKVLTQFGFEYNPNSEVNEGVLMGLARNKLIYNKRYCPCFMVIGETKEEQKAADNRVCPCKPALEEEIPNQGHCHCGIFCTPEYATQNRLDSEIEEVVQTHSRGLTKDECEVLLHRPQLNGDDVEALLEAREIGFIDFKLVDVREPMEYKMSRITGTDYLVPTTRFYQAVNDLEEFKSTPIIVYCHTGSRSRQVQEVMGTLGFKQVSNLEYGIVSFHGKTERG
jgi:ferredoxin-thioredoxin reductase catalytic subunit/rhodanese-related sulfurtransferase